MRPSHAPLVLALLLTIAACSEAPEGPKPARPVMLAVACDADVSSAPFLGEVRAVARAELSFAVAGRVADVRVVPGQRVGAGEVLARIDLVGLDAQVRQAQADTLRAQASAEAAEARRARFAPLVEGGAVAPVEWEAVRAEARASAATAQAARAQYDALDWQRRQGVLVAPFDGVVATRTIEVGQSVGPGAPAIVVDGGGREVRVQVPSAIADALIPGASARLGDGADAVSARVDRVADRRQAGGVREVRLVADGLLPPGDVLAVRFTGATSKGVWVPAAAVFADTREGWGKVLRYRADKGVVERATVRLGEVVGDRIHVLHGLVAGDRVVARGIDFVTPGAPVAPIALSE